MDRSSVGNPWDSQRDEARREAGMKRIGRVSLIACAGIAAALVGCQTSPSEEQPYSTRGLERKLTKRFDLGMPAGEVVAALQKEGWTCRPVVNGQILMEDLTADSDYTQAEALMCQRVRNVIGAERVYQVRIGLTDGLVSSGAAVVERFKPASPTWGYR
jgi:hypothetical protein